MTAGPNCYDVLDVEPAASNDEIREAWRAAIADLTPADRRFRLYNQAAEVLLDDEQRAAYDAELVAAEPEPDTEPVAEPGPELDSGAPTPPPAVEERRPSTRVVPTWLIVCLAVLVAASVGLAAHLASQPSEAAVEEATGTARTAAERAAVPLLSYDHRSLDADQEAAHDVVTSRYRSDYDDLFELIRENAPATRTVVEVEVVASAIVRAGDDRAEILLFVNRPTTNKATQEPVVYKDQVTLTMERVGEEWLVDDLTTSPIAP
ncbi:J domain-containing protein [Nocardioides sp.]|uniref:J domain-containing protein n=1 Tax=Nocardioides sp. TaxID=35761 RepID=UPI002ED5CDB9